MSWRRRSRQLAFLSWGVLTTAAMAALLLGRPRPALNVESAATTAGKLSHSLPPGEPGLALPAETLRRLPLVFEPNFGQVRGDGADTVRFLSRGGGYTLFLRQTDAVVAAGGRSRGASAEALRIAFPGSNPSARLAGTEALRARINYFRGNDPHEWRVNVPAYSSVAYRGLYSGIDLVFYGYPQGVECDFRVAPGADPARIALGFGGLGRGPGGEFSAPRVDADGNLVIRTRSGEFRLNRPVVFQPGENGRTKDEVRGRYRIDRAGLVRVELGAFDPHRPLVIDPSLSYSTFLGGSAVDIGYGVVLDSGGNMYVAGTTGSTDFPQQGAAQSSFGGDFDAFVTKISPDGSTRIYSTYIGGTGLDRANALAVDSAGAVYLAGFTSSPNFPATTGAFETSAQGNGDAFVVKLDPTGAKLDYATYLGGENVDSAQGIAVDASGNAFVTGYTQSTKFPLSAAPLQSALAGTSDAFITKLDPAGATLVYSTYFGGTGADAAYAIALDAAGQATIAGSTVSTDLPVTVGAYRTVAPGSGDGFVAQFTADGTARTFATYLGGSGLDRVNALALDASGNVFLAGFTASADFPVTTGTFQGTAGGAGDAFVTELNAAGTALVYSSFLGGSGPEEAFAVAVDPSDEAFVTGVTQSLDFPILDAMQASPGGGNCGAAPCSDAFVTVFNSGGTGVVYSTFLGGAGADVGYALALDGSGNAFVTGTTGSADYPVTVGALQAEQAGTGGTGDAFIAKIATADAPAVTLSPQKLNFGSVATNHTSAAQTVTLRNLGSAPLLISSIAPDTAVFAETDDCAGNVNPGGAFCTLTITFTPTATGAVTGNIVITDSAPGSPHNIPVTGSGATPAPKGTWTPASFAFGDQTVGTVSAPRALTLTNTGTADLNITKFAVSGDYTEDPSACPPPVTLAEGASCAIGVTFKPSTTGSRSGALSVTDDASPTIQSAPLSGNGIAVFSLASDVSSATVSRNKDTATFKITATAPANFTTKIALACSKLGQAACTFSPTAIAGGETSTLTVSNLATSFSNDVKFSVGGSASNQTSTVPLEVLITDFTMTIDPSIITINAGDKADYTLTLAPVNGFNEAITLTCGWASLPPQKTTCSFLPSPTVTLDGTNNGTATVELQTTPHSGLTAPTGVPPRSGPAGVFVISAWATLLSGIFLIALASRRRRFRFVAPLAALLLLGILASSCNDYYVNIVRGTDPGKGTQSGIFVVSVVGTAGKVKRGVTTSLGVK